MDINEVMRRLPHRYPFLLVDRVLECSAGKSIRALKNVTFNEPFFPGHFPTSPGNSRRHDPRSAGAGRRHTRVRHGRRVSRSSSASCTSSASTRRAFASRCEPGDQLILKATLERSLRGIWKFATVAEVDGEEVAAPR